MFRKERDFWRALFDAIREEHERERDKWAAERQELLNRIARPEQVFIDREPPKDPGPPSKDLTELAQVGGVAADTFRPPDEAEDG